MEKYLSKSNQEWKIPKGPDEVDLDIINLVMIYDLFKTGRKM